MQLIRNDFSQHYDRQKKLIRIVYFFRQTMDKHRIDQNFKKLTTAKTELYIYNCVLSVLYPVEQLSEELDGLKHFTDKV